ncbi:hypothetical protein, variant [Microbotryum lychnidis-dioicae p1A1 Lamole]|uniref:3'-5' exonuclease domain-containing protein n=1 Tax=Microbotryum lychnidis-dioicae (strain p1A1 Lamole / MvSl-1064) TaxID=683840 RepID=U5HH72_USTV1|nr:hypothetical protein, variant [Microbotryum lychnidis-dioicae p1A1 Lamole]|eukprot:KDE03070.1 hypothetical protein, variant [Microbotryum lychnidis-dioicae p1A1 Lamole]
MGNAPPGAGQQARQQPPRIAVDVLQFAWESLEGELFIHVIQLSLIIGKCAKGRLPDPLVLFLQRSDIVKVGVGVAGDLKRIANAIAHAEMWNVDEADEDPVAVAPALRHHGGLELVKHAASQGHSVKKGPGHRTLAGLCERFLLKHLPKNNNIRRSMQWADESLPQHFVDYAALDAYASLRLYHKISEPHSRPVSKIANPRVGTQVAVIFHGFKWDKSRAIIAITQILTPGALVPEYNFHQNGSFTPQSLADLKATSNHRAAEDTNAVQESADSFSLVLELSALVVDLDDAPVPTEAQWTSNVSATHDSHHASEIFIQEKPSDAAVSATANESDRTDDVDAQIDDHDKDSEMVGPAEIAQALQLDRCKKTEAAGKAIWGKAATIKVPSSDDTAVQILIDLWHFFDRIYVSKKHGAAKPLLAPSPMRFSFRMRMIDS